MKTMRSFISSLAVTSIVLAMASTLPAQNVMQGKAKVIKMKGEARYTVGTSGWKTLHTGDILDPGSVIQTETKKGSFVDLVLIDSANASSTIPVSFNPSSIAPAGAGGGGGGSHEPAIDQNIVRVWENTVLGIDKLTSQDTGANMVTDTQLDLKAGRILGAVKKMSHESRYEIKLPNGVAGIRGTIYEASANGPFSVYSGGPMVISWLKSPSGSGSATPVEPANPPPGGPPSSVQTIVLNAGNTYNPVTGITTPIPQSVINQIIQLIQRIMPAPRPVFVPAPAPNKATIQYVSPTK